ncbi:unnamed protein product [Rotaria sordida]|uniref:Uncharacterized protein n=1 Tax=Rotaria sordida TaxID=392033 RepID=A0A815JYH7_9BILA|nr:unnamed protein product [Rotaria sordida]CAF1388369.1 unnamed protein product [Rotaria sordida]
MDKKQHSKSTASGSSSSSTINKPTKTSSSSTTAPVSTSTMVNKQYSKSTASGSSSSSTTNEPKKSSSSSSTAASVSTPKMGRSAALPQPARRIIQNFLLVWLDANIDESKEDFQNSLQQLRRIVASITTFTDAQQCCDYLSGITKEKAFMIVSGSLGQKIVPKMEAIPQLESVYVFCGNQSYHEQWAKKVSKIKGVYTKIEPICQALEIDRERCDRAMISVSFNGLDPLFMYTQLLKEALLEIEDDDRKSLKDLAEYCREQDDISEDQIKQVENEYRNHTAVWWYTAETFIYPMLNRGLRQMDVTIILKMGFFIRHLHNHIAELHREQQSSMPIKFQVFRGQGLSMEDFEKMKKTKGGLMSFNNFLSTSRDRTISLEKFARPATRNPTSVGILFVMTIDAAICTKSSTPFAEVSKVGYYKDQEEEILFSTHTIFRIDRIERLEDKHTDRLWQVNLTLAGNQDDDFNKLTAHLREEQSWSIGWARLGHILIKQGEPGKAAYLYQLLLDKTSSDKDRADYNLQLGTVYQSIGEYSKAITFYERAIDFYKKMSPPSQLNLASSYNNIGVVYRNMGEYSKALSSYERSLEIQKIALPPNHPNLASSYNNIGLVYNNMGEYSKALSYYEKDLEISLKALPPNHPDLAKSYNNIGNVYGKMGEYSKALSSYERSLEIQKIALPPNHPDLAASYNNIGVVNDNMGEYSKALSSYERSLQIRKIALPPNHTDLAASYENIGLVYYNMGEYSKALSSHERSLEIKKIALPPNHSDLAGSYNNIGLVYDNMGEYSKALSFLEKAHEIDRKTLPPNHPHIAQSKRDVDRVKKKI